MEKLDTGRSIYYIVARPVFWLLVAMAACTGLAWGFAIGLLVL